MPLTGNERSMVVSAIAQPGTGRKLADVLSRATDGVHSVTFGVGAESGNAIPVTITVRTVDGRRLDNRVMLDVLLVSNTSTMAYNAIDYTITATTGTVQQLVADQVLRIVTDATGVAVISLSFASTGTSFMVPVLPLGELGAASSAITHV